MKLFITGERSSNVTLYTLITLCLALVIYAGCRNANAQSVPSSSQLMTLEDRTTPKDTIINAPVYGTDGSYESVYLGQETKEGKKVEIKSFDVVSYYQDKYPFSNCPNCTGFDKEANDKYNEMVKAIRILAITNATLASELNKMRYEARDKNTITF